MEANTIIEVQAFGDFGSLYTECIMTHPKSLDKDEILKEFYQIQGISSYNGLSYEMLRTITEDFISFLTLKGFTKLKTQPIYFSD